MIVNYLDRGILFVYYFKPNCPATMKINLSKQAYNTDKPQKYIYPTSNLSYSIAMQIQSSFDNLISQVPTATFY